MIADRLRGRDHTRIMQTGRRPFPSVTDRRRRPTRGATPLHTRRDTATRHTPETAARHEARRRRPTCVATPPPDTRRDQARTKKRNGNSTEAAQPPAGRPWSPYEGAPHRLFR